MTEAKSNLHGVGRPRSDQARLAVLESALKLVNERPPAEVTIKLIASEAGVGRQTIYRWWRNRGEIVLEALREISRQRVGRVQTDQLRDAIFRFVGDTVRQAANVRSALAVIVIDAQQDADFLKQFRSEFVEVRRNAFLELFQSDPASSRLSEKDKQFLADLVYGPLWYRLLVRHAPLDAAFAKQLAESALEWHAHRTSSIS